MVDFRAFPAPCPVTPSFRPYISFLFVRTPVLLMASFRLTLTGNTLANRYYFLSTRRKQGLAPCQSNAMPDTHEKTLFPKVFRKSRKRIETLFSQLCDQFMLKRNYAKSFIGLCTRIISKITAVTCLQYQNTLNKKPMNHLKFALT